MNNVNFTPSSLNVCYVETTATSAAAPVHPMVHVQEVFWHLHETRLSRSRELGERAPFP